MYSSWVALDVKNSPANVGNVKEAGLIPGSGRSPREGNGNPLQYSWLKNPMDRGARWATVHGVTKNQTQLKWLSTQFNLYLIFTYVSFYGQNLYYNYFFSKVNTNFYFIASWVVSFISFKILFNGNPQSDIKDYNKQVK